MHMKSVLYIHSPQKVLPCYFGDSLTFPLAPPAGQNSPLSLRHIHISLVQPCVTERWSIPRWCSLFGLVTYSLDTVWEIRSHASRKPISCARRQLGITNNLTYFSTNDFCLHILESLSFAFVNANTTRILKQCIVLTLVVFMIKTFSCELALSSKIVVYILSGMLFLVLLSKCACNGKQDVLICIM